MLEAEELDPTARGQGSAAMVGRRAFSWTPALKAHGARAFLLAVLASGAALAVWRFSSVALLRLRYAGELEWMEGGCLVHVHRVLSGQPLYVEPGVAFTPFIYPPLYYWLGALPTAIAGLDSLAGLRFVSLCSSWASMVVIAAFVWRRHGAAPSPTPWHTTAKTVAAATAAGLFAASFPLSGFWFDLARVDSLFLCLLLTAVFLLFSFRGTASAIGAGAALTAAALTKQSALSSSAVLVAYALLRLDRRGVWFCATAAMGLGLSYGLLELGTDGWFSYYVLEIPRNHAILDEWIGGFWERDVWGAVGGVAMMAVFACLQPRPGATRAVEKWDLPFVLVALILPAWISRFHSGMADNVLMPLHAALAIGVGCALAATVKTKALLATWTLTTATTLFVWGYDPTAQQPDAQRRLQAARAIAILQTVPPNAWFVTNQAYGAHAGARPAAHAMALFDVIRDNPDEHAKRLRTDTLRALREQRFGAVITPSRNGVTDWFWQELRRHYRSEAKLETPHNFTGWDVQSRQLWVPKPKPSPRKRAP